MTAPEIAATVAFAAAAVMLVVTLPRLLVFAVAAPGTERAWVWSLLGVFAVALAVRMAVPWGPANWYTNFLGQPHGNEGRYGPGAIALQLFLRETGLWSDSWLFASNAVVGALAAPLVSIIARERLRDGPTAIIAGLLLAVLAPHARISGSASEHVMASAAVLGSLAAWPAAVRGRSAPLGLLALTLGAVASLTRADAWPVLLSVPLWGPMDDQLGRRAALGWTAATVAMGALVVAMIIAPENLPINGLTSRVVLAVTSPLQFVALAVIPPFWFPLPWLVLGAVGLAALRHDRAALSAVLGLWICDFAGVNKGGLTGLLEARYHLPSLAIAAVVVAVGVRHMKQAEPKRLGLVLSGSFLLGLWPLSQRYTFEDEYTFLRASLAQLPFGCRVVQVPVQGPLFESLPDCCLDMSSSPLLAAYPGLEFSDVDAPRSDSACVAYYESALCGIAEPAPRRYARGMAAARERCGAWPPDGFQLVDRAVVSDRALDHPFHGPVEVGLYLRLPTPR